MFLIAKIFSLLLSPFFLAVLCLLFGLSLLWLTKRQLTGKVLVSAGFLLLLFLSIGHLSDRLLKPLEGRYPPLLPDGVAERQDAPDLSQVKWIVVLGGGHISDPRVPVTSRIATGSLVRLTEAVRLHRALPESKIVLMGGPVFDPVPEVETAAAIAQIMNVSRRNLVLEKASRDTEDQAVAAGKIVGSDPFILVTSASHMTRAMALFKKMGMKPIAAPTHYRVLQRPAESPQDYIPSSGTIGRAENAAYEYLCMLWSKIRNKI